MPSQSFDFSRLNPEQLQVANHRKGPQLVVAVAGSGKTAALVAKVVSLVNLGTDPSRILAVTFSKKGANEINERIEAAVGFGCGARVGTFHSVALQILKAEVPGMVDNKGEMTWKIPNGDDPYRTCIKEATGFRGMKWKAVDVTLISHFVSICKSNLARPFSETSKSIALKFQASHGIAKANASLLLAAYNEAEDIRRSRRLLTFDDFLIDCVELLKANEEVRERWASRWDYVIQDEAQDQNLAQLEFGELLAKDHRNYTLIGDPSQCIYTWRGAQPSKLLSFEERWGAEVVRMGRNYRCAPEIADVGNLVLAHMDPATKLDIEIDAQRCVTGEVSVARFATNDEEAHNIGDDLKKLIEVDGVEPRDISIIYRTNAQSRAPEEACISRGLPYQVIGGVNFYARREVSQLLAYLRVALGTGTIEDVKRCINAPFRYLGMAFLSKIEEAADEMPRDADLCDVVLRAATKAKVQRRQLQSVEEWVDIIDGLRRRGENGEGPAVLIESVIYETRFDQWLKKDEGEESTENSRVSNVRELVRAASRFQKTHELLSYVDEVVKRSRDEAREGENKITLCSIHRSKGLEWGHVFIVSVNDGVLPHARCEDIEEERRLFYVAVTRARDSLRVSYVEKFCNGNRVINVAPSQFLFEAALIASE